MINGQGTSGRDLVIFLAKLAVSVLLIGFLLSKQPLDEIKTAMESPRWGWLLAAFAVYGISAFGGALQWSWILRAAGVAAPAREIQRLYIIGLFFNNFLPANIGGDAYKIVDLGRREHRPLGVFCSTLLDRLIGLSALTGLAVLVMLGAVIGGIGLPNVVLYLLPAAALMVALLAALLSRRLGDFFPRLLRIARLQMLAGQLEKVAAELSHFRHRVRWLNGLFAFSLGVQLLRMATHLLVARGLGFDLTIEQMLQLLVLIPLLALSLTLPVTINGIGLRESLSVQLLTWAGIAAPAAVAMETTTFLITVVFSLQGGVLLWLGRWSRKKKSTSATIAD